MSSDNTLEETTQKKGRHRKKQLYNSILQQMEFYFSDSNLSKDRFLKQLMETDPYVELTVFLKFNKIRRLTSNIEDIRRAVSKSNLIQLSEDQTKICRKVPIKVKTNTDDCTLYVERIKSDATHEWLSSVFSEFGNVVYVSIPKYKNNKSNKGFAFVEFETENEAKNALEYFDSIGCKMPSHIPPEELYSIATYEANENTKQSQEIKKENFNGDLENAKESKKRKLSDTDFDSENEKKKLASSSESEDIKSELQSGENVDNEDSEEKKKKKKKGKKKTNIKEFGLQVLSKLEWKKMRNRYLDEQRKKMKQLKQHLHNMKYGRNDYTEVNENPSFNDKKPEAEDNEAKPPKLEFTPGIIAKIHLSEPCSDTKKLKAEIKANCSKVLYVDIPLPSGSEEVYVRFSDQDGAKTFSEAGHFGKTKVLADEEEKQYWDKIQTDREVKFKKSNKKQRGRDKLLKKAEKELAKHIRFDDND